MALLKESITKIYSFTEQTFGGTIDLAISVVGVMLLTDGSGLIGQANEIADIIIKWGMATIVGYGVLKILLGNILWPLFFGKKLDLNIAILEKFYKFLRPVKVQKMIETTEEEEQQKTLEYLDKIEKTRQIFKNKTRRCLGMDFKKVFETLNANKWTILGVAAVATTGALQGLGVIQPVNGEVIDGVFQGQLPELLTMAGTIAAGVLGLKAALGAGIENVDQYKARIAAKKAKVAKVVDPALVEKQEAEKLAKKLGVGADQALVIVKARKEAANKKVAELNAKKEQLIIAKLAKELGITEDQAKIVRKAQLDKKQK